MEYEKLSRRELQALSKKNKIPANITNVAMIEALKALTFVEGIEEVMQASQSGTTQSSVESPEGKEVTSPRVMPTGGRTTRRKTAVKEPATLQPTTRTRRSTRKNISDDAAVAVPYATETPAVVQTTKKAPLSSVCRKMDSQFMECEEVEKKGALETPAPSGVTTRRRRGAVKEETVVKREYSTRRSVRLSKKTLEVQDVVDDEKSSKDVNMCLNESMDNVDESMNNVDEASATSGVNAMVTVEEIPEPEDVSSEKQQMQPAEDVVDSSTIVEENLDAKDGPEVATEQLTAEVKETEQVITPTAEVLECEGLESAIEPSTNMEEKVEGETGSLDVSATVEMEVCAEAGSEDQASVVETIAHGDQDVPVESVTAEAMEQVSTEAGLLENSSDVPVADIIVNPTAASSTPLKASAAKASATKQRMTILSDNKENIDSAIKVSLAKETVMVTKKPAKKNAGLEDLSIRQLTKMLKQKLQISNEAMKNAKDNELNEQSRARPALQALPENRLVNETEN